MKNALIVVLVLVMAAGLALAQAAPQKQAGQNAEKELTQTLGFSVGSGIQTRTTGLNLGLFKVSYTDRLSNGVWTPQSRTIGIGNSTFGRTWTGSWNGYKYGSTTLPKVGGVWIDYSDAAKQLLKR